MIAYYPFDSDGGAVEGETSPDLVLRDASDNCWHLTPVNTRPIVTVPSEAPIGGDAPLVCDILQASSVQISAAQLINSMPAVSEYGDLQVSATGEMVVSRRNMQSVARTVS